MPTQWGESVRRHRAGDAGAHLGAFLPADPQVASGEEADHSSPGAGADPALFLQLDHDGVYPGEARLTLGPLGQGLGVLVPGDLNAHGVPMHLVKVGVVAGDGVEELPLQEPEVARRRTAGLWMNDTCRLTCHRIPSRRESDENLKSTHLSVHVGESQVDEATRQTSKPQVRAEDGGTGQQGSGLSL